MGVEGEQDIGQMYEQKLAAKDKELRIEKDSHLRTLDHKQTLLDKTTELEDEIEEKDKEIEELKEAVKAEKDEQMSISQGVDLWQARYEEERGKVKDIQASLDYAESDIDVGVAVKKITDNELEATIIELEADLKKAKEEKEYLILIKCPKCSSEQAWVGRHFNYCSACEHGWILDQHEIKSLFNKLEQEKKALEEKVKELEGKSVAYDKYLEKVEKGDIIVLTQDEIGILLYTSKDSDYILRFLEEHSNYKSPDKPEEVLYPIVKRGGNIYIGCKPKGSMKCPKCNQEIPNYPPGWETLECPKCGEWLDEEPKEPVTTKESTKKGMEGKHKTLDEMQGLDDPEPKKGEEGE